MPDDTIEDVIRRRRATQTLDAYIEASGDRTARPALATLIERNIESVETLSADDTTRRGIHDWTRHAFIHGAWKRYNNFSRPRCDHIDRALGWNGMDDMTKAYGGDIKPIPLVGNGD